MRRCLPLKSGCRYRTASGSDRPGYAVVPDCLASARTHAQAVGTTAYPGRSLPLAVLTRRSDRKLRVLEMLLNISEEPFGVGAVDDAVIEAERKVSQVANGNVIFALGRSENSGPFFDLAHTEDRHLRLIDDRGAE